MDFLQRLKSSKPSSLKKESHELTGDPDKIPSAPGVRALHLRASVQLGRTCACACVRERVRSLVCECACVEIVMRVVRGTVRCLALQSFAKGAAGRANLRAAGWKEEVWL